MFTTHQKFITFQEHSDICLVFEKKNVLRQPRLHIQGDSQKGIMKNLRKRVLWLLLQQMGCNNFQINILPLVKLILKMEHH